MPAQMPMMNPNKAKLIQGQHQKQDHRKGVRDLDVHKEERGTQDHDADKQRLGRGGPDIAHHNLKKLTGADSSS